MDHNAIFYKDFRDLCQNLKDAKTFEEVEVLFVYAFAMCDYLNAPVAEVYTEFYNPKVTLDKDADKTNEQTVLALWLGFMTVLSHGAMGICDFKARPYRDTDGHILKVELSGVKIAYQPSNCTLSYDFDEYYQQVTAPPINLYPKRVYTDYHL